MNTENRVARHYPQWLPISIILILATVLFTYKLGAEGFWVDELFSIRDASLQSFGDIYNANSKRPLYYLLLHVWMQFGSSDVWLRSLSVITSIFSVFLIYRLGDRIAGKTEGLIAAILLSTSPLFVNHTQEVRMYALSLCLGLAGTLFLSNALLDKNKTPSQWTLAGWALFRVLAIYTVPLNLMLLLPDSLLVFLRFRKERGVLIKFALWFALIVLLWSPSILSISKELAPSSDYAGERAEYSEAPGLKNLVYPIKYWMVWPFASQGSKFLHYFYKAFTLVVTALIGAGLIYKHKKPSLSWSIAWFILPLIPIIAVSTVSAQLWEPRYVLFVSPYLFILMAAGFARLWRHWKAAAIVITALYVFGIGGALNSYYAVQNRADYRDNIATIEQYEQPGDAVLWGYGRTEAIDHYYDGKADVSFTSMRDIDTPQEVSSLINEFPAGYERLWVVVEKANRMPDDFESTVAQSYQIEETFDYGHKSRVLLLTDKD